jgi:hypothetical protein
MARVRGGPKQKISPVTSIRANEIDGPGTLVKSDLYGGVDMDRDPETISPNQVSAILNYEITTGPKLRRRSGTALLTPVKPNSNEVLLYAQVTRFNGTSFNIRFTRTGFHVLSGGTWNAHSGGTFSGTDTDFFRLLSVEDRFFFANNGANAIQELNPTTRAVTALGNAPRCKYFISFSDRIVAFNLVGASPNPIYVGWSGNRNYVEWSQIVDISAGNRPLSDGGEDFTDDITGAFAFSSNESAVILRKRSVWSMVRRASASSPFLFSKTNIRSGCDCPESATEVLNGVMWYDIRTNHVYLMDTSFQVTRVSAGVRSELARIVSDPNLVSATYDTAKNVYILSVVRTDSTVTTEFRFHLPTASWTIHEYLNTRKVFALESATSRLKINQLIGKINQLVGKINSLGGVSKSSPAIFRAVAGGDISIDSETSDTDYGTAVNSILRSKLFTIQDKSIGIAHLRVKYVPERAGSISFHYSKDRGQTFKLYKTISFDGTSRGARLEAKCVKYLHAAEYIFEIRSSSGIALIGQYEIQVLDSGERRQNSSGSIAPLNSQSISS